jgi:outer membrane protein assembly factor BamD
MKRLLPLAVLLLGACAGITDDVTKNWTAERFYQEAREAMSDGDYATAIKHFEGLEARFPYGRYAEQAQLEIAYAYYKYDEPALATAATDRFIRLHPTHPNVDYAYYLKGLVYFRLEKGFINWLLGSDEDLTDRDPKGARDAYITFRDLVDKFPKSRYREDATQRMAYLFDLQAKYEIKVARFYFERGAFVATANRAKVVLENYPRTPSTEDALGLQLLAYDRMGLKKLKDDTQRLLKLNFPKSKYLEEVEKS